MPSCPTPPSPRRRALAVACLVALGVSAACSGGDTDDPADASDTTASPTVLSSAGTEPTEPTVELAGTSWRLVAIERDGATVDAAGTVPAVVTFTDDELEAYDGVNTATATYDLAGDELTVDALSSTEIAPIGPDLPQYELFDVLDRADRAAIEGDADELRIVVDGSATLVFEPTAGGATD